MALAYNYQASNYAENERSDDAKMKDRSRSRNELSSQVQNLVADYANPTGKRNPTVERNPSGEKE